MLEKERAENDKRFLIGSAFTAWLSGAAGRKVGFTKYLQSLGLADKEPP